FRAAIDLEDMAHQVPIDRCVEKHWRRQDQTPLAVQNHAAEISRFADDRRVAGAVKVVVHFIDQARDLVAWDLDSDGVHARALVRIRLPWPSTRPLQPGGISVVASNCSTMAGAATVALTSRRARS